MTLVLRAPGAVPNAPAFTDFRAFFTGDPRVVGVWVCDADGATIAGGQVSSIANLKTGGVALLPIGGDTAALAYDEILKRQTLHFDKTKVSVYGAIFNRALYDSFTTYLYARQLAVESYTGFSYAMKANDGASNSPIFRLDITPAPALRPKITALIDQTGTPPQADIVVPSPYSWNEMQFTRDAAGNITLELLGVSSQKAYLTSVPNSASTTFNIGSTGTPTTARMPVMNIGVFAIFNTDINAPQNADLKRIFKRFREEACRV